MVDSKKKDTKLSFSEDDAAALLDKYDPNTILTLLHEVSSYPNAKIDWNEMVRSTATGISNAREYQMLWRHLAYRDGLSENLEDGAEPMDDDSDLECELETFPSVNNDTALEASACAKVMMSSGALSEPGPSSSTIEAPMVVPYPVCHSSITPEENTQPSNLMHGSAFIFPVTVQRQTLPTVSSTEGLEAKGTAGGKLSSKRRRKAWSEEEDMQLRAAVQKCGEGNWATMSKGDDFPIKRSPTQLAQRWSILRKKDGTTNSGANLTSSLFTAEQLATRHSLSLALDMPLKKLTAPGTTDPARTSLNAPIKNPLQLSNTSEASAVHCSSIHSQHPSQQAVLGSSSSPANPVVPEKTVKSNPSADAAVMATAVAVGARIVSSSAEILSLQKATQERNAVKIMSTGSSSMKLSAPAGSLTRPKAYSNLQHGVSAAAVASTPASSTSIVKDASPTAENAATVNPTQKSTFSDPSVAPKDDDAQVAESMQDEEILEDKLVSQNPGESDNREGVADQTMNLPIDDGSDCHSPMDECPKDQSMGEKQENLPSVAQNECHKSPELPNR